MPRKSRKENIKNINIKTTVQATVGYIRLSVANKDESCSVNNQKRIIEEWAGINKIAINSFYIDENKSGSTFERPAFKRMIEEIKNGNIECVIVKDLSRLGREFISTSFYIEEFFPSNKVRFVSVNDKFDTIDGINNLASAFYSNIRVPITNAFNEQVSIDIKKKIQTTLDVKAANGMFIGARAPYGYRKSSDNHFVIEKDEEAAEVVRKIFSMADSGKGITAIVRYLNENNIPTPMNYARSKGLQGNYNNGSGIWNTRSVKYILTNQTYTGVLVQGKEKRVVKGTHEPLVDINTFERIQNKFREKAFNISSNKDILNTPNILKGKVICKCCGSKMQRRKGSKNANWYFFTCITNNRVSAGQCIGMYIREDDIFNAIYHQLKLFIRLNFISDVEYERKKADFEKEINKYQDFMTDPIRKSMKLYEMFVSKKIDKVKFKEEKSKIDNAKELLKTAINNLNIFENKYERFLKILKVKDKELPLEEIINYIDKIIVGKEKRVVVKWDFL